MFKSLELFVDQIIQPEKLVEKLHAFHYHRTDKALEEGQFSQRGGVLDIFPVNFDSPVRIDFDDDKIQSIASVSLTSGKSIWQHRVIIIIAHQPSKKLSFTSDVPLDPFVDIEAGDYVVHHNHGIGKFLGVQNLEVDKKIKEHLVIEYSGGDKLFVPQHDIRLVQKYISFTKKPPRLYTLGNREWQRVRNNIQKQLQRFAAELLHIQALRLSAKGFAFCKDIEWQKEFEDAFPFEETPDQIKAITEVKKDMESEHPMDRLICGDVGYGKTEVALRAIFKAVMDNKQVVVLVPTTILAEQHYFNFSHRLKNYPVKISMLSRFCTPSEQAKTIRGLHDGNVDIVVGTHRLLSKDISFKDLGLIVIDEEQRFGVKSKEKLKHLRLIADVLTLTATPIPRTLYMTLSGAKDMSVIATPPQKRIGVETHIIDFDEDIIKSAIEHELKRRGQVFFLHNHIEDIERVARIIQRLVPQARTAIGHGQMPPKMLEHVMLKFLKDEIDVLICTTIIGSGIDIPNANTLIVNRADRFGLSDLHQLRGRVGRFTHKAYAYFIVPARNRLAEKAKARINAIEKYHELGSGFHIALEDLQIRGAGNILGEEQHGYIVSIGFDLYCRLLKESIENLKRLSN